MKKKLMCIILSLTLLSGCTNSPEILISYSDIDNNVLDNQESYIDVERYDFFANDLSIIPDDFNHMADSDITAVSALLIKENENNVIFANNIYERIFPASLTKLITALVVFNNSDLSEIVTISYNASHITEVGAKLCGLREGDKISMETLLNSFLVYSGNDAGIAIAEHIAGSEEAFANMMNETAKGIGAVHSNFVNAHGLHNDDHYTTAYDLYLIFHELLQYDKFISIINQVKYVADYKDASGEDKQKEFYTTNRYLLGKKEAPEGVEVVGGKTGSTSKAGSCLLLYTKDENNDSYISVIIKANNSDDLFNQMNFLLNKINIK